MTDYDIYLGLSDADMSRDEKLVNSFFQKRLHEWLQHDSWVVRDALLLMANIVPEGVDVNWDGYKNHMGVWLDKPAIVNAQLFSESYAFYLFPSKVKKDEDEKIAIKIRNKNSKLHRASEQLNRIKKLWDSAQHENERYPIQYYLNWAKNKDIEIPWLTWAESSGLISRDKEGEISAKSLEVNYLNKNHRYFAEELKIAVEAWVELYEKNPPSDIPKGGHRKYIKAWLVENFPNLGRNSQDRIITIINPNRKGGSSPSES